MRLALIVVLAGCVNGTPVAPDYEPPCPRYEVRVYTSIRGDSLVTDSIRYVEHCPW